MRLSRKTMILTGMFMGLLSACRPEDQKLLDAGRDVFVSRGVRDIHPENRNVQTVGLLPKNGVDLLMQYVKTGRSKKLGYVLSEFYLRADGHTIGVVEKSDGTLIGLDVTTDDVSKLPATSSHRLIVNDDAKLSASLLQTIKTVQDKTSKP